MKKINVLESAMKHYQIIVSMVVVMMVLGIFGILNMPRNEFPDFTIRQGIVVGIYPEATSMEVEEQLTFMDAQEAIKSGGFFRRKMGIFK